MAEPDAASDLPVLAPLPPPLPVPVAPPVTFGCDFHKLSYTELRRDCGPAFPLVWLAKALGSRITGAPNDPLVERLEPWARDRAAVPALLHDRLTALEASLRLAGFDTRSPLVHVFEHTPLAKDAHASFLSPDATVAARACVRAYGVKLANFAARLQFVSRLADGSFLVTTDATSDLDPPPGVRLLSRPRLPAPALLDAHRAALRDLPPPQRLPDLASALDPLHDRTRDNLLARGVFKPLDPERAALAAATAAGDPDAPALAELRALESRRKSGSRFAGLVLLAVSVFLFVAAGRTLAPGPDDFWSWRSLSILVAVLLFHEIGHFLAMKALGYRDLRMFFIPLLGAAVTGVNRDAPGWKRVLVALAGPAPGIALGVIVAASAFARGLAGNPLPPDAWVLEAALMLLILNGLNLLPVLPADGGHVARTLLFARHWLLDVGFRAAAVAVLLFVGFSFGDYILSGLGVMLAVGMPAAYRVARAASALRASRLPLRLGPDGHLPEPAARHILASLRNASTPAAPGNPLLRSRQALEVYQTAAERIPAWPASIAWGTAYAATLVAAFAGLVLLVAAARPDVVASIRAGQSPLFSRSAPPAEHPVALDQVRVVRPYTGPAARRAYVAVELASDDLALSTAAAWLPDLAEGEALLRVGRTLAVTLPDPTPAPRDFDPDDPASHALAQVPATAPSDPRRVFWASRAAPLAHADRFSYVGGRRGWSHFRVTARFDDAATAEAVRDELRSVVGYHPFGRSGERFVLAAPWSDAWASADPASRAAWTLARDTLRRYNAVSIDRTPEDKAEEAALQKRMTAAMAEARRRGEDVDLEPFRLESGRRRRERFDAAYAALRASTDRPLDLVLFDLLRTRDAEVEAHYEAGRQASTRPLPPVTRPARPVESPTDRAIRQRLGLRPSGHWGDGFDPHAVSEGRLLHVDLHAVEEPTRAVPRLLEYLTARGATLRVQFIPEQ